MGKKWLHNAFYISRHPSPFLGPESLSNSRQIIGLGSDAVGGREHAPPLLATISKAKIKQPGDHWIGRFFYLTGPYLKSRIMKVPAQKNVTNRLRFLRSIGTVWTIKASSMSQSSPKQNKRNR